MVKTLVKPVNDYLVGTNNDAVMEKFMTRMLPSMQFGGTSKGRVIQRVAEVEDGETVWKTLSQNSNDWNPRSLYNKDHRSEVHIECR